MEENIVTANSNPNLLNELGAKAMAEPEQEQNKEIPINLPADTSVDLPGGYITPTGEVIRSAEVRELNGRDEEAISRASTLGRMLNIILSRGVATIGGNKVDESVLDNLFAGDRDALLLGIYRVTFGNPVEVTGWCEGCNEQKIAAVDLLSDIKSKVLADPIADRVFTVEGRGHTYKVTLPTGHVQKELNSGVDKTLAELGTILLQHTVLEIDGVPVYSPNAVANIGIQDRRKISEEIADRTPGPKFDDIKVTCPDCEGEVVIPISFGSLFQF
jgi:hypothetical protein